MDATGNCVKIASVARFVTDAVIVNQHCKHVLVMAVIDCFVTVATTLHARMISVTRLGARDALVSKGVVKTQKLKKLTDVKKHGARVVRQHFVATIVVAVMNALLPRLNLALWVTVKVRVISAKNVSKHVKSAKQRVV